MGEAKNRRQQFLHDHPWCVFCGGDTPATSVEHCPPRSLFQFRHWPEGFEFPACEKCNGGTADDDLLIAFLARLDPFKPEDGDDGRGIGIMMAVNAQFPGLLDKMFPSPSEARKFNRELGIEPAEGQTHQQLGVAKIPEEFRSAIAVFSRKLAKAILFKETGRILSRDGGLAMLWNTSADLIKDGKYVAFDILAPLAGVVPKFERSRKLLDDQFVYKFSANDDEGLFLQQTQFGRSFMLVILGCTQPGRLEDLMARVSEQTQRHPPFRIIQGKSDADAPVAKRPGDDPPVMEGSFAA